MVIIVCAKVIFVYIGKIYGHFSITGRQSATAGLVARITTESRRNLGRPWVRLLLKVILFVFALESVTNAPITTLIWL